jgi:hypothetical protein
MPAALRTLLKAASSFGFVFGTATASAGSSPIGLPGGGFFQTGGSGGAGFLTISPGAAAPVALATPSLGLGFGEETWGLPTFFFGG